MSEEIEKLIKIQGAINRDVYHLFIETNLEDKYRWALYLYNPNIKDYLSSSNNHIMISTVDSIDDLINYLEKHDGFRRRW